jgi:hypothetical protein
MWRARNEDSEEVKFSCVRIKNAETETFSLPVVEWLISRLCFQLQKVCTLPEQYIYEFHVYDSQKKSQLFP